MVDSKVLWTAAEIAKATGGKANSDFQVSGTVHIDSRKIGSGDLFIAIEGPNNDGHAYMEKSMAAGAGGGLVHKPSAFAAVLVEDTFEGLQTLADASVERSNAKRIGITGSVGKTGTKELLAAGFSAVGQTHATEGNLNNHFGLPLTLSRMPRDTAFAVLEMGMDHAGEISALTKIAKPHVAIITKIAKVHMEFFNSLDEIAHAKAEIFEGVQQGGFAVLNIDDPYCDLLTTQAVKQGLTVLTFGTNERADARLVSSSPHMTGGQSIKAHVCGTELDFSLSMNGDHYGLSAMAVLLTGHILKQDINAMAQALSSVKPLAGRGEITQLADDIMLIDESYNANPTAMNAAFDVLCHLSKTKKQGRKVAILGDMLELGGESEQMHADLGTRLLELGVDAVFCCGSLMKSCFAKVEQNSGTETAYFENSIDLSKEIGRLVKNGDTILVKGSLGSAMAKVCQAIKQSHTMV